MVVFASGRPYFMTMAELRMTLEGPIGTDVSPLRLEFRRKAEALRDELAVLDPELRIEDILRLEWIRPDGARLAYHPPIHAKDA